MIRYKLILFLILLPLLTKSKSVRSRRPIAVQTEEPEHTQHELLDQIALADTWKSPNKVISATYSGNPQTGHIDHANLVINIVPRHPNKPAEVEYLASQSLANAKTAEEYVNKALELKHKYEHTTPSSSFVKYDVYESEKKKRVPAPLQTNQIVESIKINAEENSGDLAKSSTEYHEYYQAPEVVKTTTTTTYNPDAFKDLESSNSDFTQQFANNYDSSYGQAYGAIQNINYENQKAMSEVYNKFSGYPSKQELYEYIEKAVMKYMTELNLGAKLGNSISPAPSAHAEIKTYYRLPSALPSPSTTTKLISTGTHSEFFKPAKSLKGSYATVKPFVMETYTPNTIDLTGRYKKRPSALDLATLDVGQTLSHSSNSDSAGVYHKPYKPKYHLNSQTYHDINSLPYSPNRGLLYDSHTPYTSATSSYRDYADASSGTSYKDDGLSNVGASISFGSQGQSDTSESEKATQSQFTPSMQVINGIPVTNPYKFNMHTLNDIFDNESERAKLSQTAESDYRSNSGADWNPYNLDLSNVKENLFSPSKYPYDSYNPKYNNNPEGHGYQDSYKYTGPADWELAEHRQRGTTGSDMYTSGSTHKVKKIPAQHSGRSHGKRASKPRIRARNAKHIISPHNHDLERELQPPLPK